MEEIAGGVRQGSSNKDTAKMIGSPSDLVIAARHDPLSSLLSFGTCIDPLGNHETALDCVV